MSADREQELLNYIKARDAQRLKRLRVGLLVAIVVAALAAVITIEVKGNVDADRQREENVEDFRCAMQPIATDDLSVIRSGAGQLLPRPSAGVDCQVTARMGRGNQERNKRMTAEVNYEVEACQVLARYIAANPTADVTITPPAQQATIYWIASWAVDDRTAGNIWHDADGWHVSVNLPGFKGHGMLQPLPADEIGVAAVPRWVAA